MLTVYHFTWVELLKPINTLDPLVVGLFLSCKGRGVCKRVKMKSQLTVEVVLCCDKTKDNGL